LDFRVWDLRVAAGGFEFGVRGFRFGVKVLGYGVWGQVFRV